MFILEKYGKKDFKKVEEMKRTYLHFGETVFCSILLLETVSGLSK